MASHQVDTFDSPFCLPHAIYQSLHTWREVLYAKILQTPCESLDYMYITKKYSHQLFTQVDKECTNSVHSIPLPKWVFYHCSVYFKEWKHFITLQCREVSKSVQIFWKSHKKCKLARKKCKNVSHPWTLHYLECKTSAKKWQTSGHFWSTWVDSDVVINTKNGNHYWWYTCVGAWFDRKSICFINNNLFK